MRRLLAWLALGVVLVAAAAWSAPASAQQQDEAELQRKAEAFVGLWQRLEKVEDAAARIALSDEALKLEGELDPWPLSLARDEARGQLLMWSGLGYSAWAGGERAENLERAIAALESAERIFTRGTHPGAWAWTQNALGSAYQNRIHGDRADNLDKAVAAFEAALTVRTREASPADWALAQDNLGIAYAGRMRGDRADNLEKAIAAHQAALAVRTRETMPREWAWTQHNLAAAYADRLHGNRADNQEMAIAAYEAALTVRTRDATPHEWAATLQGLAILYANRALGNRVENLEKSIEHMEAALTVLSPTGQPRAWAEAQRNLGLAFGLRTRGERADNVEKGIAAFEAALTVLSLETFPQDWAQAKSALALLYGYRIRGQRAENLERAIDHTEDALKVLTREALPDQWAQAQLNLGFAYHERRVGAHAENLDRAIRAFEAALTVMAREANPQGWALAQMALGRAHASRGDGNPEAAIAAYEAALTVFRSDEFPLEWSIVQGYLGGAYLDSPGGDRQAVLAKAIGHLEAALTVQRQSVPRDALRLLRSLGTALSERGEWRRASQVYAEARESLLLLSAQGLDDTAAAALIDTAGPLFAEAAYAAAQLGEMERALTLASEGRARLMAAALKLQTLNLPPEKRRRLDELRADLRVAERTVEAQATQGAERAAAVERLVGLRQELLSLVKDADAVEAKARGSALVQARALAGKAGAVAVPVVTRLGGTILIVRSGSGPAGPTPVELPELTTTKLDALVRGVGPNDGWLGAYAINLLPDDGALDQLWPKWMAAIDGLGPDLWRLFGARLDSALKRSGVKAGARLVWLPTGALGILPLGLAQDPAGRRRVLDGYEIVYAPSLEALTAAQNQIAKAPPATLAVVVNPTGDLPAADQEGRLVASLFSAKARAMLEGSEATPEAVLAALKGRSYWHFASHGTFTWGDARQSALLMHGLQRLSVGRLLEADGLGRPRLVVLSACETGLHDISRNPDEFIGLPGTFTALGAAGVLGTLWPVNDMATALLVARFYDLHLGGRLAPPTALRQAQLWLRQATNADLVSYAKGAARQGRLDTRHVAAIEDELSADGLRRARKRALVEWIGPVGPAGAGKQAKRGAAGLARPYAHPYYWAGFIYTGL
jgi:CHAT domain-containing protein/tetratricopeptide (TPR) repeat protein